MPKIKSINNISIKELPLQGYLFASYLEISARYGSSSEISFLSDGFLIDICWVVEWNDDVIATIYSWKYSLGSPQYIRSTMIDQKIEWSITSSSPIAVSRITDDVKNFWPVFDDIRMELHE